MSARTILAYFSILSLAMLVTSCGFLSSGPEYVKRFEWHIYLDGGSIGVYARTSEWRKIEIFINRPDAFEPQPSGNVNLYLVEHLAEKRYPNEIMNPSTKIEPGSKTEAELQRVFSETAKHKSVDETTRANCAIVAKILTHRYVGNRSLGWR